MTVTKNLLTPMMTGCTLTPSVWVADADVSAKSRAAGEDSLFRSFHKI
jgi:hypothetical protein